MIRIVKILSLSFLLCSLGWSQDWQSAFEELEQQCSVRINSLQITTDSLASAIEAQQITIANANILIKDLTKYQEISEDLSRKYDELVTMSDSTKTLLQENVELHKATAKDWEDLAKYMKVEYEKLIKKYSRSLWQRWELYAGLVAGLVIGAVL